MLDELIPNVSRHFMCSLLEHDYETGNKIIQEITQLSFDEISHFLCSLHCEFDGLLFQFESDLKNYSSSRDAAIDSLKSLSMDDVEELN